MFNVPGPKGNVNQNHIKILPHSSKNGYHQEHLQQQMLVRMWGKGTLIHCWWECKLVQPLWKSTWRFLKKLKAELPSNTTPRYIYLKEYKSVYNKDTCTAMFIAELFTIAKLWK
jgi:hypothetical protein